MEVIALIEFEELRKNVVSGLSEYLGCTVIRGNQTGKIPDFPFLSYNITTYRTRNGGTYGVYDDGKQRIPTKQIWSLTVNSDNYSECAHLVNKAYDWLENVGSTFLKDNNLIVESLTNITDRSNILTYEYIYTYGFDCTFYMLNNVGNLQEQTGYIDEIDLNYGTN